MELDEVYRGVQDVQFNMRDAIQAINGLRTVRDESVKTTFENRLIDNITSSSDILSTIKKKLVGETEEEEEEEFEEPHYYEKTDYPAQTVPTGDKRVEILSRDADVLIRYPQKEEFEREIESYLDEGWEVESIGGTQNQLYVLLVKW